MDLAVDIEDITAPWLSQVLGRGVRAAVHCERVGSGVTAATYRLNLDADGAPETLVAKVAAGDQAAREQVAPGFRAEVGFYSRLVDSLDVRTPSYQHAAITDDALRFTLLLEVRELGSFDLM